MKTTIQFGIFSAAAVLVLLAATANLAGAQTYKTLDDPPGVVRTFAYGISGNNVVGFYIDSNGESHGFMFNGSTYTTLDDPLAYTAYNSGTEASGISGNNIVGRYTDSNGYWHNFLYNGSTYTTLPDDPLGLGATYASGVSGSNIVGSYIDTNKDYHGFLYNGTTYTTLDDPLALASGGATLANGISGSDIVGQFTDGSGGHGFLYNGLTYTTLDDPLGIDTVAYGISGTNIVGYYFDTAEQSHGFLYNGLTYTTLDDPLGIDTYSYGISGANIVGFYYGNSYPYVFLLTLVPPSIPTNLTAVANGARVALSWSGASAATSYNVTYNVYCGTTAGAESATPIATGVTTTSYTSTGLIPGATYYYRVAAENAGGTSGYSNEADAAPVSTPTAPSGLTLSPGNANVTLKWTASPGATSYSLFSGTASGVERATAIATGITSTHYANTHLTNGTTYYYKVAAVNAGGTSGYSNEASGTPEAPPVAPIGLAATPGNAKITLNWAASPGAVSYNVYSGTTAGGERPTPIATGITSTHYTNTHLTNGATYYYKVAAANIGGSSGYSNEASATPEAPPVAPVGLTATAGNAQVVLKWTASLGAINYNVYSGTTAGGERTTPVATGITSTHYTNNHRINGWTYYYKVTAVNAGGTSGYSNEASATPAATGASAIYAKFQAVAEGLWGAAHGDGSFDTTSCGSGRNSGFSICSPVNIWDSTYPWADDSLGIRGLWKDYVKVVTING